MNAPVITTEQQSFITERVRAIKRELLRAWWGMEEIYSNRLQHALPLTVNSFSQLHDYCDANCLGGLADDHGEVAQQVNALFPAGEEQIMSEEYIDTVNTIQNAIHEWLETRASVRDFAFIATHLEFEQVDCLLDDERTYEAHGMLGDMRDRVGTDAAVIEQLRAFLLPQPQWTREFPTMAEAQNGALGIEIPAGWTDGSWHNDACPAFYFDGMRKMALFVSDADPEDREIPGERFLLCFTDKDGCANGDVICCYEDADLMVEAMNALTTYVPQTIDPSLTRADVIAYLAQAMEGSQQFVAKDANDLVNNVLTTDDMLVTVLKAIPDAEWKEAFDLITSMAPHHHAYQPNPEFNAGK